MDKKFIRSLAEIAAQFDLTSISVKENDFEIEIKREHKCESVTPVSAPVYVNAEPSVIESLGTDTVIEEAPSSDSRYDYVGCHEVKSPMVGVFYCAPKPGEAPFVKVGDMVSEGDVLCIIEAMKIMNEIKAERSGKIVDVCCKDAELVEFGQTIFKIK